jgi:hypothetical protein
MRRAQGQIPMSPDASITDYHDIWLLMMLGRYRCICIADEVQEADMGGAFSDSMAWLRKIHCRRNKKCCSNQNRY